MSKMKLLLHVVQNLQSLAASLEELCNAIGGSEMISDVPDGTARPPDSLPSIEQMPARAPMYTDETKPARAPMYTDETKPASALVYTDEKKPDNEPPLSIVDLRAFVAERSTPENRPKIKAILNSHGVNKLTELPEDKYETVMREVAAI